MFMYIMLVLMMLVLLIYLLFYFISYKMMMNMESSSSYECGFSIMSNTRMMFSYRFFLIGILFLIFDVEIVLMLSIPYLMMNEVSIFFFMFFLIVLVLGLTYEYYWGSLEWMN